MWWGRGRINQENVTSRKTIFPSTADIYKFVMVATADLNQPINRCTGVSGIPYCSIFTSSGCISYHSNCHTLSDPDISHRDNYMVSPDKVPRDVSQLTLWDPLWYIGHRQHSTGLCRNLVLFLEEWALARLPTDSVNLVTYMIIHVHTNLLFILMLFISYSSTYALHNHSQHGGNRVQTLANVIVNICILSVFNPWEFWSKCNL